MERWKVESNLTALSWDETKTHSLFRYLTEGSGSKVPSSLEDTFQILFWDCLNILNINLPFLQMHCYNAENHYTRPLTLRNLIFLATNSVEQRTSEESDNPSV